MNWFENLLITPFYLIILLVILTLIGIFIVKNTSISDKQWRKFDFWCLIFASLGIFCILSDNREFFYTREANIRSHRINTFDSRLRRGTVSKKSRFSGMVNKVAAIVAVKVPVIYRKNV